MLSKAEARLGKPAEAGSVVWPFSEWQHDQAVNNSGLNLRARFSGLKDGETITHSISVILAAMNAIRE